MRARNATTTAFVAAALMISTVIVAVCQSPRFKAWMLCDLYQSCDQVQR